MKPGRKIGGFLSFLLITSLLTALPLLAKEIDEKIIIIEGKAEGTSLKAEEEALRDALRNAVEEGVGVFLDSQTLIENFQLLGDYIYTEAQGYIREYSILSISKGEDLTIIEIRAVVAPLLKLKYDLKALRLIKSLKGDPRIMITILDIVDEKESITHLAETELIEAFLEKDLNLVDRAQADLKRARDVALNYEDYSKAAVFGSEIGAEILITGQAITEYAGLKDVYGTAFEFYSSLLEIRAVRSDTATLLFAKTAGPLRRGSFSKLSARTSAIKMAVSQMKENLLDSLFESWRKEVLDYDRFLLTVTNLKSEQELGRLEGAMGKLRGVKNIYRRSYFKEVATLEIDFEGNSSILAEKLAEIRTPRVKVIGTTQNRVDLEIK